MAHQPVLLQAVVRGLDLQPGEVFVDATVNRGGHARALCDSIGPAGRLIGIDLDRDALREAKSNLRTCPGRTTLLQGNFRDLQRLLTGLGVVEVDAVLMDLGMSSEQLIAGRGFSFRNDEPLLMTFRNPAIKEAVTAREIINVRPRRELALMFRQLGEEPFAEQIAREINLARRRRPIETTGDLARIIETAVPSWYRRRRLHWATRAFQAVRIAVNDELAALQEGLTAAWRLLRPGGRLAVITFHSLEARMVKRFFQKEGVKIKTLVKPSYDEIRSNPRSRSAQLRIIQKVQ